MQKGEVGKWIRVKTIFNAMGLNSGGVGSSAEVDLIAYFRSTVHCARLVISQYDGAFPPIVPEGGIMPLDHSAKPQGVLSHET